MGMENDIFDLFSSVDLEERPKLTFDVNYSYPHSDQFDYEARLERIDYDKEREHDIQTGKGFIISSPKATLKKDIKNPDGIFSSKFGQRLGDMNPFMDRYRCSCGELRYRINHGRVCKKCHTICRYVDDDFSIFGWILLKPEYPVINPDMYQQLDALFGKSKYVKIVRQGKTKKKIKSKLLNIIDYGIAIDQNGQETELEPKSDEPYYGIGMLDFYARFDEILEFYHKKNPNKQDIYDDIMVDRDKVFIHSIPVYTTHLRPVDINDSSMYYEKTTGIYNMMTKLASYINKNATRSDRTPKLKNQQLFNFQMKFLELYNEIVAILSGKKGNLRMLVGGRFNFSSREVIKQDPELRIDQVKLPYVELVITQEQRIINVLHRTYNISYQDAYDKWYRSISEYDPTVEEILMDMIRSSKEGLPVIINRNPTIAFGGIMQMFCVGINHNFCLSVPLQVLPPLAADFDGDSINVFHIINEAFFIRAYEVFNPRNNMYISKNDGMLNKQVLVQRDTLINANTLVRLSRGNYSEEDLANIRRIKQLNKVRN